ncbi:MAG TPA: SRPBCC family protein [Candidatus Limnocylindrales bacterium]|nr:SRPBCC family protein [Candidatus Limnocylindrales bacterium]
MIRFGYEERIEATPEAVFAVMSDIGRFNEWLDMDGRPSDVGPVGQGSRFESSGQLGPIRYAGSGEVTAFVPDHRFGFRYQKPKSFDFEIEMQLDPVDGGTRLVGKGSMTTHGLWRLLEPVFRMELGKGEAREARRLKAIVEGAEAPRAPAVGSGW